MLVMVTLAASAGRVCVECEGKKETKLTLVYVRANGGTKWLLTEMGKFIEISMYFLEMGELSFRSVRMNAILKAFKTERDHLKEGGEERRGQDRREEI